MRVAVVVAQLDPKSGGGFTFEQEILHALKGVASQSRHEFTVLVPEQSVDSVAASLAGSGLSVRGVPRRENRITRIALRELEVARAHWRRPSDIDRVTAKLGADFVWFLSAAPDRTQLPYMTVVWDVQHRATPWFPELSADGTWDGRESYHRWFLRRATRVITGTKIGHDQLVHFYQIPTENILVLPHPTPRLANAELAQGSGIAGKYGLPSEFVLYPAQFWPHKNHANLVLAIAALARTGQRLGLALPGSDKGNRAFIEQLAEREGIKDLVRFLGFVEQADLIALYREAAALAYVSWCGPENLPPLEAFGLECPVVASRIAGSEEQFGDAVEFCDPGDPDDIARAIKAVTTDENLRSTLIAAGKRRATRFTPSDYVAGAVKFLDEFESVRRCWP